MKVLGLGDNVVDKYMHSRIMYPGGNALNIAVLARMCGADSAYLGVFGDDAAAKHVYSIAKELEIDLSHCRYVKGANGYAEVELQNGDRVFIGSNKGGVSKEYPLALTELDLMYMKQFQLIHTSIFSYIEDELEAIAGVGAFLSMDFSDKASDEEYRKCAPYLDCACVSYGSRELEEIKEDMQKIMSYGCRKLVLATRGAKGAVVLDDKGRFYDQSPCLVEAKDTMGAGDSFITAFLVSYLEGIKRACDFPENSGSQGIYTYRDYEEKLIQMSMYQGAVFSAENCGREGTFGFGKAF